jgi:hypothetical protein
MASSAFLRGPGGKEGAAAEHILNNLLPEDLFIFMRALNDPTTHAPQRPAEYAGALFTVLSRTFSDADLFGMAKQFDCDLYMLLAAFQVRDYERSPCAAHTENTHFHPPTLAPPVHPAAPHAQLTPALPRPTLPVHPRSTPCSTWTAQRSSRRQWWRPTPLSFSSPPRR